MKHFSYFMKGRIYPMKKSKSLLKTTVTAIGILHCINKIIDSVSITNSTTKTAGKYYHWKHGDIFYRVTGSGSPLLLIHDLTVYSSNYEWLQLVEKLSENHTVYAIDLIGCGKSDKPAITYTNYFYVQMVTDFVKEVIQKKTDVAVTGLSCSFVLMANYMDKELFNKITLVSPSSISYLKSIPDERSKVLLRLFELPVIGKTAYYMAVNKSNVEDYLTEKCYYNPFNVKPGVTKAYYDAAHTANGDGKSLFASLEGLYLNADITTALKTAENEIIMINGSHRDRVDELEASYQAINPSIECYCITESKHLPQLEAPETFLNLL